MLVDSSHGSAAARQTARLQNRFAQREPACESPIPIDLVCEDDSVIQIEGVTKRFDDTVAVDQLDLNIPRGSLYGLVGPNGAGKTTTLKMLATLLKPDDGRVVIDGHDLVRDVRAVRKFIGYMPDAFGTFRGMSGEEYLQFFGRSYGVCGAELEKRVDDVLELTDLTSRRHDLTSGLSTGLKQRLSLAKALVHDPQLLLLDEPASGLDPRARIEIRSLLHELKSMGKTIVISSHILSDLEEICTDIAIVEHGTVAWQGPISAMAHAGIEERQIMIEVPPDFVPRAHELLQSLPEIDEVRLRNQRLEAHTKQTTGNAILRALIDAEIDVLHFSYKSQDLESLFLSRTKGLGSNNA